MIEAKEDEVKPYGILDKYAFLTFRALENNHIGYCYREYSDIKIDSGWRFLYGNEDENYLDNPDNCETMDIAEIVSKFPEINKIIEERYNSEWEWNTDKQTFDEIK